MFIKKIKIKNIRSYESLELEIPKGSVLLCGDIGAGKTSILMAIEFALFGLQPSQKSSALMRNDAQDASVSLWFDLDGKIIEISRSLKKSKSITQDECNITIDGEKKEMSVTELKSLVLTLLQYPDEFSKKQNLLYKFTVYTPQESMKQIIQEDAQSRLTILRYIFGIEKYKRVLENTSLVLSKMREERKKKEGQIEDLEIKKQSILEKEQQREDCQKENSSLEKELFSKNEDRKKHEGDITLVKTKIEEKRMHEKEAEKIKSLILGKKELLQSNVQLITRLTPQIEELKKIELNPNTLVIIQQQLVDQKSKKERLEKQTILLHATIQNTEDQKKSIEKKRQCISTLDNCPTCLQLVNVEHKLNVTHQCDDEFHQAERKKKIAEEEKILIEQELMQIKITLQQNEEELTKLRLQQMKLQTLEEKEKQFTEIQNKILDIENEMVLFQQQLSSLDAILAQFGSFEELYLERQSKLDLTLREERVLEIKLAGLKKEIELIEKQILELKNEVEHKIILQKQAHTLKNWENWMSEDFVQLIGFIERNVLATVRQEFSLLFNKWFSLLVSDTLTVRLDDDFTPIIEQQDYEIEYSALSGGERTAVALAYRLALNQVINSMLSNLKTRGLIILDEPTDGFSEQQLDKMRDIFQQITADQLLIVSHEQKIEGFVEHIIKLSKQDGTTKVDSISS